MIAIAIPLLILALAAGVHLLIKVNREYMGGLFKFFAWLVIVLSLLALGGTVARGVHHMRARHHFMHEGFREGEERIIMKQFGVEHCKMDSAGSSMSCCKMSGSSICSKTEGNSSCCKMSGDSIVVDKAMCEKMMGKEACDKLCKERGQCIMSKDECAKMCSTNGKASCCMGKGK